MIKIYTILFIFTAASIYGQTVSGGLKVQIKEKTKNIEGARAVINETITVILNDSVKHSLITDAEGDVRIKNLSPGKYTVKIIRADCETNEFKGIMIGEGKTAYVTFHLTCTSYINSLTKKEKKKLGYK